MLFNQTDNNAFVNPIMHNPGILKESLAKTIHWNNSRIVLAQCKYLTTPINVAA